ncbi:PLC-like phosphodiesterase [Apiosordaria backusii]|uniref:PLC-like phosphodiesterase n=1 Tax=Apiosordaria backusii TaxID=314023 RepID=A0AA40ANF2_9PEZI|nr:PLC-like phosphodiesterase [Apiosordaria backusii]
MRVFQSLALVASFASLLVNAQDACKAQDRTFSTEQTPAGKYQPSSIFMNPTSGLTSSKFYISVVNLTPHRIKLENTHSYQMDTFDFGDIPQGRSRQNTVKYRNRIATQDDAGEAYYRIDGTDKKFALRLQGTGPTVDQRSVTLDLSGMNLGQRVYKFPGGESSVSLVITGSAKYGFYASIRHDRGGWMRWIYNTIRDRPIRHLFLPGTHDSGMSKITNKITSIGNSFNTQNQGINIYDQLRAGSRWFDLRIGSVHDNNNAGRNLGFHTLHVNDETADLCIGNSGESLDEVISEINLFTRENPGEVMFFSLRYLIGRYEFPDRGPIYWNTQLWNDFLSKIRGVNNRCPDLDTSVPFQNQPASYFMDRNDGKGCVIFLLNGQNLRDVPKEAVGDGLYALNRIGLKDHWSNMQNVDAMAPNQIDNFKNLKRGGNGDFNQFHIAQWLVSPDAIASTTYGLQAFAIQQANPALYWAGVSGMSPEPWPNVMMVDYIGVQQKDQTGWHTLSAEMYWLGIGMNLYVISENCDVNKWKSPLIKARELELAGGKEWNGIIFANGTVVDQPSPELHPGHTSILRNGTIFANGTMLETTIPNPWI